MNITDIPSTSHELIRRIEEPEVGLIGFIALHSTRLGPAAGGLRMRPYDSEADAITDVMRLSEGMTYKNAAAGLPLGGGKAVIMGDPAHQKTPALLAAFGRAIEGLSGRYYTAEDMGMTPTDMAVLAKETTYVGGLASGEFASGDPSPITARGIFNAIRTTAKHRFGNNDLTKKAVSVQGLGNVGWHLCTLLHAAGAKLFVTDINEASIARAVRELDAEAIGLDDIYAVDADIFAPCAIGGILNSDTIPMLKVQAVAGGANNQLATHADSAALHQRGILYAPDFVANGGGIINVATEILRIADRDGFVAEKLTALDTTMDKILTEAAAQQISPADIAHSVVAQKIAAAA